MAFGKTSELQLAPTIYLFLSAKIRICEEGLSLSIVHTIVSLDLIS
jgi:hypothetical protein